MVYLEQGGLQGFPFPLQLVEGLEHLFFLLQLHNAVEQQLQVVLPIVQLELSDIQLLSRRTQIIHFPQQVLKNFIGCDPDTGEENIPDPLFKNKRITG